MDQPERESLPQLSDQPRFTIPNIAKTNLFGKFSLLVTVTRKTTEVSLITPVSYITMLLNSDLLTQFFIYYTYRL